MGKFTSIESVAFKFMKSPTEQEAHCHLNSLYSDHWDDIDTIFTTPQTNTVVNDKTILTSVRNAIVNHLILPVAQGPPIYTADLNVIMPIIKQCPLMIELKYGTYQCHLNKKSMEQAMIAAINGNQTTITICIIINALDFKSPQFSFLDWSKVSITSFIGQSPSPAPATAQDIAIATATAVDNVLPPPLSAADLSQAVAAGIAAMPSTLSFSGGSVAPAPHAQIIVPFAFNLNSLPDDVKD